VVCRLALHQVQQPANVVSGMARVCRAGGTVLVGPGYIAEAFAKKSREVLGMDLTAAMLDIAPRTPR